MIRSNALRLNVSTTREWISMASNATAWTSIRGSMSKEIVHATKALCHSMISVWSPAKTKTPCTVLRVFAIVRRDLFNPLKVNALILVTILIRCPLFKGLVLVNQGFRNLEGSAWFHARTRMPSRTLKVPARVNRALIR